MPHGMYWGTARRLGRQYREGIPGRRPNSELSHGDRLVPVPVTVPVEGIVGELDEIIESIVARLDPLALGAAVGWVSAVGLLLATAILLIKGGAHVGPTLSLLGNYLPGFEADLDWCGSWLSGSGNGGIRVWLLRGVAGQTGVTEAYAMFVRWRGESDDRRHLLEKLDRWV